MTKLEQDLTLLRDTERVARAVAAGDTSKSHELVRLGKELSRAAQPNLHRREAEPAESQPIMLMRQASQWPIVRTAGDIRAALAERPMIPPVNHLKMLRLGTLPVWPLPADDAAEILLYHHGHGCLALLLEPIGAGDEPATAKAITTLTRTLTYGPRDY